MDSLRDAMEQQNQQSSMSHTQEAGLDLASEMAAEAQAAETQTLLQEVSTLNQSVREQEDRQGLMLQQMRQSIGEEMRQQMKEQMGQSTHLEELKELLTSRNADDGVKERMIELEKAAMKAESAHHLAQQEAERHAANVQRLTAELEAYQPKLLVAEQQVL